MSDKELIELAAKAAGLTGFIHEWINGPEFIIQGYRPITWTPLADDGDALRLAASLNIELRFHLAGAVPSVTATCIADSRLPIPREPWGIDKSAATRRAIVRAAAEIGRTK